MKNNKILFKKLKKETAINNIIQSTELRYLLGDLIERK